MARIVTLAQTHVVRRMPREDALRSVIVAGCALALIVADRAFPILPL